MPRPSLSLLLASSIILLCTSQALAQGDPHSPKVAAESRYQTAVRLFGEGRYREALDEFDAAIALSPESIFYCNRAIVLIQLREPQEALESLRICQQTFTGDEAELAQIDAQRAAVDVAVNVLRPGATSTVSAINAPQLDDSAERWTRANTGYLVLGLGGALFASAATLDLLSGDLKEALQTAADGRSIEDYDVARDAYVARRRIWLGLTAAGAVFTLSGGILVVSHFIGGASNSDVELGLQLHNPGMSVRFRW